MRLTATLTLVALSSPTLATGAPKASAGEITVVGIGTVRTPPDIAAFTYAVRGEGAKAAEALQNLVAKRTAIENGLVAIEADKIAVRTGEISIKEVRSKACDEESDRVHLSTGACAVTGVLATLRVTVTLSPVTDAATAAGAAARLGASDVELSSFKVSQQTTIKNQAAALALADARRQAEAIAIASGGHLGTLLKVHDETAGRENGTEEIAVTAQRRVPAPALMITPLPIFISPEPIETELRLVVTYAIAP